MELFAPFFKLLAAIGPSTWLIIVLSIQLCLFALFLMYGLRVRSRFGFIVKRDIALNSLVERSKSSTLSLPEKELYDLISPYWFSRLSEHVKRSDIFERVLSRALQNEEVARAFMNGIIVLGLFGTITIVASRFFLNGDYTGLLAGETDVKLGAEMLNILPFAFVPSSIGLFLALVASIILSLMLKFAYKEADRITDRIMSELPKQGSVEESIKGVFSSELQQFLKGLPDQMKTAFTEIRDEMQHFLENLVSPYAESMKQATDQVPQMSITVQAFGSQLSEFSEKIGQIVEHTARTQIALSDMGDEFANASQGLKKSVKSAQSLFEQFEERYRAFSELYHSTMLKTTEKFGEIIGAMEENHKNVIIRINQTADGNYVNWINKLNENEERHKVRMDDNYQALTKELINQVCFRTQDVFLSHKEELAALKGHLALVGNDFCDYINNIKSFNQELQCGTTEAKELASAFQTMVTGANSISANLRHFTDIEKAIDGLHKANQATQRYIRETDRQSQELIRQVRERLERLCTMMNQPHQKGGRHGAAGS